MGPSRTEQQIDVGDYHTMSGVHSVSLVFSDCWAGAVSSGPVLPWRNQQKSFCQRDGH